MLRTVARSEEKCSATRVLLYCVPTKRKSAEAIVAVKSDCQSFIMGVGEAKLAIKFEWNFGGFFEHILRNII